MKLKRPTREKSKTSMSQFIYKILHSIILSALTLIYHVKIIFQELFFFIGTKKCLFKEIYSIKSKDYNNNDNNELDSIEQKKNLILSYSNRLPNHVCIILNETLSIKQIIDIILCILDTLTSVDIKYFTFYKQSGLPLKDTELIVEKVYLKHKLSINLNGAIKSNSKDNVQINFCSYLNGGKNLFIKTIKNLAKDASINKINVENIDQQMIDNYISGIFNVSF